MACPPWSPPESVSSERLKLPMKNHSGGHFQLVVIAKRKLFEFKRRRRSEFFFFEENTLTSQVTRSYQGRNPWKSFAPAV
jgi:hypothetical protein